MEAFGSWRILGWCFPISPLDISEKYKDIRRQGTANNDGDDGFNYHTTTAKYKKMKINN